MFEVLKKCFSINLNDYENINFSLEINKVVLGAFVALIIGVIFLNIYRGNIRLVVMQLTRHGAVGEENAKTLSEIGLGGSGIVKSLLSRDGVLTKVVSRVGDAGIDYDEYMAMSKEEREKREKIDFSSAEFYINEEKAGRAASITEKYATSVLRTAASCVFIAIICICVIVCMPEILNIVNNLLSKVKM